MKCADKVFARRQIDAGLAPYRSIDLGQQSGRHLNKIDAAQVSRGGEPGEVANDSAAQRDDTIISLKTGPAQESERLFQRAQRLMRLAVSHKPVTSFEI